MLVVFSYDRRIISSILSRLVLITGVPGDKGKAFDLHKIHVYIGYLIMLLIDLHQTWQSGMIVDPDHIQ